MTPDELKMLQARDIADKLSEIDAKRLALYKSGYAGDEYGKLFDEKNALSLDAQRLNYNAQNVNRAADLRGARTASLSAGNISPKSVMNEARFYDRDARAASNNRPMSNNYVDQMQDNVVRTQGSPSLEAQIESSRMNANANIGSLRDNGYTDMVNKRNYRSIRDNGGEGLDLRTMKDPNGGTAGEALVPQLAGNAAIIVAGEVMRRNPDLNPLHINDAGEGSDITPQDANNGYNSIQRMYLDKKYGR